MRVLLSDTVRSRLEVPALPDDPTLADLGYSPRWEALFAPHAADNAAPGRVIRSDRGSSLVATSAGVVRAQPSVRLLSKADDPSETPAAGDWVALHAPPDLDVPLIEAVLQRHSAIARSDPGKTSATQVLATNIDTVFVVHPIAEAPNLRRIERELSLAWESGAIPVVVLTKADLSPAPEVAKTEVEMVAPGTDVLLVNALGGDGTDHLLPYVRGNRTAVLIGPSGAGKSTLINALLGEERQATRDVRVTDGRGRHTTVTRELIALPGGGVLIDTPGLRALGLTGSEEGIASAFPEIDSLASSCRFRDCAHTDEPGCAVLVAVESGELASERLASYRKLIREAQVAAVKTDARLRAEEDRKWKIIHKAAKRLYKERGHR